MLAVITVLTSIFSTIIAAIFAGLFINQRSCRVEVREADDDLVALPEVNEWLKTEQTPEQIMARMKTIATRSVSNIDIVQKAIETGSSAPYDQLSNALRSVDKSNNAIYGLLQSLRRATTAQTTTSDGCLTEAL